MEYRILCISKSKRDRDRNGYTQKDRERHTEKDRETDRDRDTKTERNSGRKLRGKEERRKEIAID